MLPLLLLLLLCVACVSDMLLTFCSITFVAAVAVALAAAVVVVCNVEIVAKLQIFSQRLRSLTPAPTHCCCRLVVVGVVAASLLMHLECRNK